VPARHGERRCRSLPCSYPSGELGAGRLGHPEPQARPLSRTIAASPWERGHATAERSTPGPTEAAVPPADSVRLECRLQPHEDNSCSRAALEIAEVRTIKHELQTVSERIKVNSSGRHELGLLVSREHKVYPASGLEHPDIIGKLQIARAVMPLRRLKVLQFRPERQPRPANSIPDPHHGLTTTLPQKSFRSLLSPVLGPLPSITASTTPTRSCVHVPDSPTSRTSTGRA
jgi:hypothetical protein